MTDNTQACRHEGINWNGEGECITCARDKVLRGNTQELRKLDSFRAINKLMIDAGIKIGHREQHIGYLLEEVLDWHNKQMEEVLDRLALEAAKQEIVIEEYGDGSRLVQNGFVTLSAISAERNKLKEGSDE